MEDEKKPQSFKVMDRRRVDEHGEDRTAEETGAAPHAAVSPETAKSSSAKPVAESSDQVEVHEHSGEINFSSFIVSLATQALMQLGQVKPPAGVDLAVDPAAARQTIDIIGMLHLKTKGNLDREEQHLIEEIVNSLKFQFVQTVTK